MNGIFISYRRDDSAGYAGRLYDRMVTHFGAERVFMDVEGIEPGIDFINAIEEAVGSCRVLIVIIGDEWTAITDAAGRRRLDDPNDFIRLETGTALKRGIRVVPVLVGGAVMPRTDELPAELQSLTRRQAIEISHKQWDASTVELIRTLEKILGNNADAPKPSPAPVPATPAALTDAPVTGTRGKWVLPAAGAALALIAGTLWFFVGQLGKPPAAKPPEIAAAAPSTETKSGTASVPETGAKPALSPTAKPAPATTAATSPLAPLPTPVPSTAPVPAQIPPPTAPAAAALPPPLIREFKAEADVTGARLCYQVSNADSLTLSPRPGELGKADKDCIRVDLESATTFTLTARNAARIVRKTLVVTPKPVEVARTTPAPAASVPATPAPVIAVPPSASSKPVTTQPGLPNKGESWTYRSYGKWPTSQKRNFQIVVQSVADGVVTDALRFVDGGSGNSGEVRRSHGGKAEFIAWPDVGPEFSPYFGAYVELARLESQSGFPTPDLESQTQWYSRLKWLGQESVSVPAGTFNAHKLEVWSNRHASGSRTMLQSEPVGVHYYVWYAAEAKRYVKMQRRVLA
ncbi:MAG TPA: TIR domain-containing protein, partial [Burkholderiales bacterium]|nr:TIR domain-containing protein [Burkholderiales bacterium]